jgi:hypothetical protein
MGFSFGGILDAVTSTATKLAPLANFITPGVGTAIGAVGSYLGKSSANQANQAMAQQQMDYQRMMSDTSYQRSVKDLKAAGLNPMLAYTQGGASTPQGATATMEDVAGNATTSAMSAAATAQQIRSQEAAMQLTGAQIESTEAEAAYKRQLKTSEILKSPGYSMQEKQMLNQMALNDSIREYNSAKTVSEKEGLPYGWKGIGFKGAQNATSAFDAARNQNQDFLNNLKKGVTPWQLK